MISACRQLLQEESKGTEPVPSFVATDLWAQQHELGSLDSEAANVMAFIAGVPVVVSFIRPFERVQDVRENCSARRR